jgi:hypothetical protein
VPAWGLKLGSLMTTLLVLAGSYAYAGAHIKNPEAPLQPPVPDKPAATAPPAASTPTPIPPLVGTRRGNPPRSSGTPAPILNLQPGVQATALPAVTFTHVS